MYKHKHEWNLKRNCSLSPRQAALAFSAPCILAFVVAGIFTLHGAWYVLAYAILEVAIVAVAFIQYARHATDHEHIVLMDGCLLIERVEAEQVQRIQLDPYWTRITLPSRAEDLIKLEAKGVRIEVGRFVTKSKRRRVAKELRNELRGGLFMPARV
ncbi:MAG TPA: DUF2244 domain-containing protein [Burkholderiaceae bacterium]|jgi:uncharacterized membrane protein